MTQFTRELLRQAFTAETIMTPRNMLLTLERGVDPLALRTLAKQRGFDLTPLTEYNRIVGVMDFRTEKHEPLTDQWLVSRDTGIPDLLSLFAESGRPGFLVFHRQDVVGLVTPADLNKLPARVFLYNLMGELELALSASVRNHFADRTHEVLRTLSEERRRTLEDQVRNLTLGNANIDPVQLLRLSDLVNIVVKQEELRVGLGFSSRNAAESMLNTLVQLRNRIMHPVRPLLEKIPEDLRKLHARVEQAEDMLRVFETLP